MAAIKIKQGEDWVKLPNVGIQSGIADAPVDDKQYVRSNGNLLIKIIHYFMLNILYRGNIINQNNNKT